MTAAEEFVCAICHEGFTADPAFGPDARRAEYEAVHHKPYPENGEGVSPCCDDCYHAVMTWAAERGLLP